jgi:hypothetical protein
MRRRRQSHRRAPERRRRGQKVARGQGERSEPAAPGISKKGEEPRRGDRTRTTRFLSALRASHHIFGRSRGSALRARPWLPSGRACGAAALRRFGRRLRRCSASAIRSALRRFGWRCGACGAAAIRSAPGDQLCHTTTGSVKSFVAMASKTAAEGPAPLEPGFAAAPFSRWTNKPVARAVVQCRIWCLPLNWNRHNQQP